MKNDSIEVTNAVVANLTDNDLLFIQDTCDGGLLGNAHSIPSNYITLCTNNLSNVNAPVAVIAHELLHSRGGYHVRHVGSILYPSFVKQDYYNCIDQYALPGILKTNPWIKKDTLNYCSIP